MRTSTVIDRRIEECFRQNGGTASLEHVAKFCNLTTMEAVSALRRAGAVQIRGRTKYSTSVWSYGNC